VPPVVVTRLRPDTKDAERARRRLRADRRSEIQDFDSPEPTAEYHRVLLPARARQEFKKWRHHEQKDERFDYLYKSAEIQEFGETLKAIKKIVRKSYGYLNNNANTKSVANAIELKHFLGEPMPRT
jgi:uncharacterized protein YecE (DUF72 family)